MKPQTSQFLQSVIFCALLIAAITGIYLFAGVRDGVAEDAALFSMDPGDQVQEDLSAPTDAGAEAAVSGDAPMADAHARTASFLRTLAEAGYVFSASTDGGYSVASRPDGDRICTMLLSVQDGVVTGAAAIFPYRMPEKSSGSGKKSGSAIDSALAGRDEAARKTTASDLCKLLSALFDTLDCEELLPLTVRLRWLACAEDAVNDCSDVSDSESGVNFEVFFAGTGDGCTLCCTVQFPKKG